MSNYRWTITITVIAISLICIFAIKYLLISAHAQQSMGEPAATIEAIHVEPTLYQRTITVNGVSQARQAMQVSNDLAGKITKLNFSSGELVKKGQVLLEQDHSEERARLIAANANLTLYRKMLDRYITLQASAGISNEAVDKATAALRTSESEIAVLKSIINKKIIRAPFEARAGIHNFQVGQYLGRNSRITRLIGISKDIWIDFYVPQIYDELRVGSSVSISVGEPRLSSVKAKIVSVEPMLSDESRQFKYRAIIANEKLGLKHNHLVKVTLPVTDKRMKIAVPNLAVIKDQLGDYVFLLREEKGVYRAHRKRVDLGDRLGDQVIVNDGLDVGDYIANKGAFKLRSGLKVFISASKTERVEPVS